MIFLAKVVEKCEMYVQNIQGNRKGEKMSLLTELEELGVDVKSAVNRLGGDEDIYQDILLGFLEDLEQYAVKEYLESGDCEKACRNAHALKGVAGNLGLTPIFKMYARMNALLKEQNISEAAEIYEEGLEKQEAIVSCISRYL